MSLLAPEKKFRIGIICAKGFDDPDWLPGKFGPHLEQIAAVYSNGVNSLVLEFCQTNGLIYTVFPITRTAPWSNSRIIENADKVYILSTPSSHNTELAKKECERQGKPFEVVEVEPVTAWRLKVGKVQEILAAGSKEDFESQPILKAIKGAL